MKKSFAVLLISLFAATALSACSLIPIPAAPPAATAPAPVETTAAPPAEVTQAPAPVVTEPAVGVLSDYVATVKESSFSFGDGNDTVYRIPEVLLGSADAAAANAEIMDRFGDDVKEYTDYSPVISLDYEAYLNDRYLSVLVTGKYDGGNSYGLCYTFDVISGDLLNNETLCAATGRDYNAAISALTANLTADYDAGYSALPGNDSERSKTLDSGNISAAAMYLDGSGSLTALTEIYAAVGGGHWVKSISAE